MIDPGADALEEALDALLTRVRWYACRPWTKIPPRTAAAFNRIADVLGKPDRGCWSRIP